MASRPKPLFRGDPSRFGLVEHLLIKVQMCLDAFIDRKLLFNALPGRSAETLPRFRIARKGNDGIADRLWVSRRHHEPGLGVDHCLGVPADIGDDHREPCGHALQNDVGEALLPRGQEAEIRRREQARYVGIFPEELDAVADPSRCRKRLELGPDAVIASGEQDAPVHRKLLLEMRQAHDQLAVALVVNEIGDDHADQSHRRRFPAPGAPRPRSGSARADFDAVIDQSHLGLRDALLVQLAHDGFRVADHRVHLSVQPALELCDQRPVALIVGEAAPAHDLDRHARRDGNMRADQIGPGKIEVSDVGAPAPHEPVELVGGKGDMRGIAQHRPLALGEARRRANLNACLLDLLGPLATLGQAKRHHVPAGRREARQSPDEVTFRPSNAERTRRLRSSLPAAKDPPRHLDSVLSGLCVV